MAEDKLAEQEYALAHPPKKWVPGMRAFGYLALVASSFAVGTAAMGIASYFLQKYGNIFNVQRYPDMYTMHTNNLALFNGIWTMLICLGAWALPLAFLAFLVFSATVMWAVIGGIFTVHVPFVKSGCSASSAKWARFVGQCKYYISLDALAWVCFALMLIWFVILVADIIVTKRKRHYLLGE